MIKEKKCDAQRDPHATDKKDINLLPLHMILKLMIFYSLYYRRKSYIYFLQIESRKAAVKVGRYWLLDNQMKATWDKLSACVDGARSFYAWYDGDQSLRSSIVCAVGFISFMQRSTPTS